MPRVFQKKTCSSLVSVNMEIKDKSKLKFIKYKGKKCQYNKYSKMDGGKSDIWSVCNNMFMLQ
jgi:hypothetical protein